MTDSDTVDRLPRQDTLIGAERLRRFTRSVFEKAGMAGDDAEILAEHLVWADLKGVSALGVAKVPQYLPRLRDGGTPAAAEPSVLAEIGAFVAVDGHDGFGQVVAHKVMHRLLRTAGATGIAAAVVRNTTSAGALGRFASLAVKHHMIGVAINNAPVLMRAPGGAQKVIGNQAFAIGSPAGKHPPVVLDMALSDIALARIHEYQARGDTLPEGLAVDAEGRATVDPSEALNGILSPMGGHRGFALAFMWEILTGILSGGSAFSTGVGWPADSARPQGVSLLLIAIDPSASIPYADYVSRVDELIDRIHRSRTVEGANRPTVPGERSTATMERRQATGVPIPAALLTKLIAIGDEAGVSM